MRSSRILRAGAGALLTAGAMIACGGEPAPTTQAASPAQPSRPTHAQPAPTSAEPVVERVTLTPSEPTAYDTLRANVEISSPSGRRATAQLTWWVNGKRVGEGPSFDLTGTRRGARIEVAVVADDGESQSEPVTAAVTLGNTAPRLESIRFEPSGPWVSDQSMAALPEAVDPDGDPLTFEYAWFVNGRRLAEAGPTIEGSQLSRGDRVVLEVVASDGYAQSDTLRSDEIEVSNAAPTITSTPGAIGPDGFFRYQVEAKDPDGDRAFMYRLLQAPTGMQVDVLGGKVVWQPTPQHAGPHTIEIEVDDRMGGTATQLFTLDVTFDRTPPASPE